MPTLLPTGTAKTGASLAEINASERRPKRVKLILRRQGQGQGQGQGQADTKSFESDEPSVSLGSALTEEEAAKMLEAALAQAGANGEASHTTAEMVCEPVRNTTASSAEPPLRRGSQRLRAISAFGEKVPEMVAKRGEFDSTFEPVLYEGRGWKRMARERGYGKREGSGSGSADGDGDGWSSGESEDWRQEQKQQDEDEDEATRLWLQKRLSTRGRVKKEEEGAEDEDEDEEDGDDDRDGDDDDDDDDDDDYSDV